MAIFQSESITVERDADGSAMLKLDVPGRTHNMITRQLLSELDSALDAVAAQSNIPLLVLRSGKKTGFLVGADIRQFLDIKDAQAAESLSRTGQDLFNKLAQMPMPTLANLAGPCLGGGLELALACDYRLVFDRPDTQIGLPEVELGLLPAWGGTQRLPTLVGLERSLEMILTGKRLGARQAQDWGLVDVSARDEAQLREQYGKLTARAVGEGKKTRQGLPLRTWRQKLLESNPLGRRVIFRIANKQLNRRVPEDMPAPFEALEAIRVGVQQGMEAGLAQERTGVGRLALSKASRHLIGLFLRREDARKLPANLQTTDPQPVRRLGVVGGGIMGAGIVQLAALKGCQVVLQEINQQALDTGMRRIDDLFEKALGRRILTGTELANRRSAIKGTLTWEGFDDVDLVVEAAVEDLKIKQSIFAEIEKRTRPDTILATNTSSLSVATLQEGMTDSTAPGRMAALHFFNPVHKMPLVEVARTPTTSDKTVAMLTQWASDLGKTPVIVRDQPGFVVNRVLMPYLNEAVILVSEGLKIDEVDRVMKRFGMPMGPLALLDQVGLDIAAHVAESMQPLLSGRFDSPRDAFTKMKAQGWLGAKSGKGFYTHTGKKPRVHHAVQEMLRSTSTATTEPLPGAARLHEARERMVLLMINESALALSEELVADPASLDLAMIMGTGWAPHRGGPLHYADDRGLGECVQALETLAKRHGKRFEPCVELRQRAEDNRAFYTSGA